MIRSRITDFLVLVKARLSLLVVFSAAMAYLWASDRQVDTRIIWLLSAGGFFITGASNILNQVIERKSDGLMKRTAGRPVVTGRIKAREALLLALLLGASGLFLLYQINALCAWIGALAMLIYAAIYTPLKRITYLTVLPGAVAGSLPILVGWAAATGEISRGGWILFSIQFIWQFPHTWSIAWLLNDDYNKAGLKMLPKSGRSKTSALLIVISTFLTIPMVYLLYMYESAGVSVTSALALAGLIMLLFSIRLYNRRTEKSALGLMLSCFVYLPFVLILLVIEKFM